MNRTCSAQISTINYPIREKESSSNVIRSFPSQSSVRKKIHGFCPGVLCVIRRAHLNDKKSKRWDVLGCLSSLSPLPQTEFLALTPSMPTGERPLGC